MLLALIYAANQRRLKVTTQGGSTIWLEEGDDKRTVFSYKYEISEELDKKTNDKRQVTIHHAAAAAAAECKPSAAYETAAIHLLPCLSPSDLAMDLAGGD